MFIYLNISRGAKLTYLFILNYLLTYLEQLCLLTNMIQNILSWYYQKKALDTFLHQFLKIFMLIFYACFVIYCVFVQIPSLFFFFYKRLTDVHTKIYRYMYFSHVKKVNINSYRSVTTNIIFYCLLNKRFRENLHVFLLVECKLNRIKLLMVTDDPVSYGW